MPLTSFRPAQHCVALPNDLNVLTEDDLKNARKAAKFPGHRRDRDSSEQLGWIYDAGLR